MRASMIADGMTFRPRHTSDPAGTEDLDGRERTGGDPHKDEAVVETRAQFHKTTYLFALSFPLMAMLR